MVNLIVRKGYNRFMKKSRHNARIDGTQRFTIKLYTFSSFKLSATTENGIFPSLFLSNPPNGSISLNRL